MKYLVANWKAEMDLRFVYEWIDSFVKLTRDDDSFIDGLKENLRMIIAPSYPFIPVVLDSFMDAKIFTSAQNVSLFPNGKYTGEITAEMIKDVAKYCIVGHSERRENFHETNEVIDEKIKRLNEFAVHPILCVRNKADMGHEPVKIIAFEPKAAIGTGANADVDYVINMKHELNIEDQIFLYGGSADSSNIGDYLSTEKVDGFLVGTASLNPKEFYKMAKLMM